MSPPGSTIRLGDLAHARSGDKGDGANIGVVADDPERFAWLREHLTVAALARFLAPLGVEAGAIRRYELPLIGALNFTIAGALDGGASGSLRLDTQGKALGTAVLELPIPRPPWLEPGPDPDAPPEAGRP